MSTQGLSDLWSITRLAERQVRVERSDAPPQSAFLTALQTVVRVGCGLSYHEYWSKAEEAVVRGRTVPSAGALYPFDVVVVEGAQGARGTVWAFDVASGTLRLGVSTRMPMAELEQAGVYLPPSSRFAVIVVLARPWRSMQRYQMRGYFYAHVDAGHAASNIASYAHLSGYNPVVSAHIARSPLIRGLGLEGMCREPVAVISLTPPREAGDASVTPLPSRSVPLERVTEEEADGFELLRGMGCINESTAKNLVLQELPHLGTAELGHVGPEQFLPTPETSLRALPSFLSAVWQRISAKTFLDLPLTVRQLGELLAVTRGSRLYRRDPGVQVNLALRVVVRHAEGLHGVYAYSPFNHSLRYVGTPQSLDFVKACMHQQCLGNASALLVVHARSSELVAADRHTALAELHVRAANIGQLVYLAATQCGVGITCVGSFDTALCRELSTLGEEDSVLYVMALGVPDGTGPKLDRENPTGLDAYAQVARTRK